MAIDATAAAASAGSASALGRTRLAESFDTFLNLLTTQLKNQDPLSPLDSNQFTQQLVQMTGVEQQLATNDLLEKLVSNTSGGLSTAVSLIGKEVRVEGDDAKLANGKASWVYDLSSTSGDVKLEVLDAKGNVVFAKAVADAKEGPNTFAWDGKNTAGNKLADGTYSLRVTAKDAEGKAIASTTFIEGLVSGVEQVDGATLITVGGVQAAWEKVTRVTQPAAPATTNNTANTNTTPTA